MVITPAPLYATILIGLALWVSIVIVVTRIGDSMLVIRDVDDKTPVTAELFMYVEDADASYKRAIQAGATSLMDPSLRPWGDGEELLPEAAVKDPSGNL